MLKCVLDSAERSIRYCHWRTVLVGDWVPTLAAWGGLFKEEGEIALAFEVHVPQLLKEIGPNLMPPTLSIAW